MISSVIVRLDTSVSSDLAADTMQSIKHRRGIEIGQLIEDRMLTATIETVTNQEMEDTTRWLQGLIGVEFVDVVFVYFDQVGST